MGLMMIIRVAFRALVRNKMRAALTMLGIIIGVSAVIAMVSIGQGAKASVQAQIESIGTNLLFISAGAQNVGGVRNRQRHAHRSSLRRQLRCGVLVLIFFICHTFLSSPRPTPSVYHTQIPPPNKGEVEERVCQFRACPVNRHRDPAQAGEAI